MKFFGLSSYRLLPDSEFVSSGLSAHNSEAEAEAASRANAVKWGDQIFKRVVKAEGENEARTMCAGYVPLDSHGRPLRNRKVVRR